MRKTSMCRLTFFTMAIALSINHLRKIDEEYRNCTSGKQWITTHSHPWAEKTSLPSCIHHINQFYTPTHEARHCPTHRILLLKGTELYCCFTLFRTLQQNVASKGYRFCKQLILFIVSPFVLWVLWLLKLTKPPTCPDLWKTICWPICWFHQVVSPQLESRKTFPGTERKSCEKWATSRKWIRCLSWKDIASNKIPIPPMLFDNPLPGRIFSEAL